MIKISAIAIISSIIALQFKSKNGEIAIVLSLSAAVIIAALSFGKITDIFSSINQIYSINGINFSYLKIMIKCLGISLICQFSSNICDDSGFSALSAQVILIGKIFIIIISLPIINEILNMIIKILEQ